MGEALQAVAALQAVGPLQVRAQNVAVVASVPVGSARIAAKLPSATSTSDAERSMEAVHTCSVEHAAMRCKNMECGSWWTMLKTKVW